MSVCMHVCMSALFSLSSVRPFTHPSKDWKGKERRGKCWKVVEREAFLDPTSLFYAEGIFLNTGF